MARYTGPKARISRKFNEPILGESKAAQKKKLCSRNAWQRQEA